MHTETGASKQTRQAKIWHGRVDMLAPPIGYWGRAIEVISTQMGMLGIGSAVFVDPGRTIGVAVGRAARRKQVQRQQ